ncbi:hypothetical protein DYB34_003438 [Aphanomyces astaci]|uniref:Uncharacterized protein n=1 Tax=Aphanomyces astaci TaxID=112090 RepID=A0A397AKD1_APHAT|nr:hypothetical protein DYB36_002004 [Aphanomyces astaci]RHY62472.1 hypothetical protein DYB34_003438 [Aphanomyces astaci]
MSTGAADKAKRLTKRSSTKEKKIKINMTLAKYEVIKKIARDRGWKQITDETDKVGLAGCNLHWIDVPDFVNTFKTMQPFQKVNHFPGASVTISPDPPIPHSLTPWHVGMSNLARKSKLARNFQRMMKLFPNEYDFCPKTWILPFDYTDFAQQFNSDGTSNRAFIIKPDHSCQGRGVFLTKNLKEVNKTDIFVAQRYVAHPLLLGGKKFDLRIYIMIASCAPLRVYLFQDGLVRMCTAAYTPPNADNMEQKFMHLTNYAINKLSNNFEKNKDEAADGEGSKRSLKWFLTWLRDKYDDAAVDLLWHQIGDICLKAILSVQPTLNQEYQSTFAKFSRGKQSKGDNLTGGDDDEGTTNPGKACANSSCFAILGMDVLVDENLKPWLLEVNHLPSFGCDSPLDWNVKERLLNQALDIMQISASDKDTYDAEHTKNLQRRLYGDAKPATGADGEGNQDEGSSDGPETDPDATRTTQSRPQLSKDELTATLLNFYSLVNPEKPATDIDAIVAKFLDNQDELHKSLVVKYGRGVFDEVALNNPSSNSSTPMVDDGLVDFVRLYPPPVPTSKNAIYKQILDACQSNIDEQLLRLTAPLHQKKGEDLSKTSLPPLVKGGTKKDLGRDCFGFTGTDKVQQLELKDRKPLAVPGPAQLEAASRLMMGHSSQKLSVLIPTRPVSQNSSTNLVKKAPVQYGLEYREKLETMKKKPTIAMTQITFGGFG